MSSAILVHPRFDAVWPFAADHARRLWAAQGPVAFVRLESGETRPAGDLLPDVSTLERLLVLDVPLTVDCIDRWPRLREIAWCENGYTDERPEQKSVRERLTARGVRVIRHTSEGFWGQSVAEFGLALTLAALRRIPQLHGAMRNDPAVWDYQPPGGVGRPGSRGQQYGDNPEFTSGTLEGKRVRIVGAGNIASRYASFCHFLGADVAAWDPFATEPCFHRSGARREHFLDRLGRDAEIFVPMVPLTETTRGLVTAAHLDALPRGALVVLVTRAGICDMPALRRRVLAGELALAADVFDVEPLPSGDPLLGHPQVVHTPHNAGRTRQANERWAEMLLAQFAPV
ncbi:MAG: NAD(P)-dependent oxidoreductase [Opitutales bacterium]